MYNQHSQRSYISYHFMTSISMWRVNVNIVAQFLLNITSIIITTLDSYTLYNNKGNAILAWMHCLIWSLINIRLVVCLTSA